MDNLYIDNFGLRFNTFLNALEYNSGAEVWLEVPVPTGAIGLTNGNILIGNASNLATPHAISGDATISNTGVLSVTHMSGTATLSAITVPGSTLSIGGITTLELNSAGGQQMKFLVGAGTAGANRIDSGSARPMEIASLGGGINIYYKAGNALDSSGVDALHRFSGAVQQTSTAGYTGIELNVTETSIGSGENDLLDLKVGGVSKFTVDRTGAITRGGGGGGGGTLLQTQYAAFSTSSGAFTSASYAQTSIIVGITPLSPTSTLYVTVYGSAELDFSATPTNAFFTVFEDDTTDLGPGTGAGSTQLFSSAGAVIGPLSCRAASNHGGDTAARTYRVYVKVNNAGSAFTPTNDSECNIMVQEIEH